MIDNYKTTTKYKTIGQVAKELNLIDKKTGHLQTHTLRYWETQFRQIKPSIRAGKRRYYSHKDFKIIKFLDDFKFLLGIYALAAIFYFEASFNVFASLIKFLI